ncbi:aminoglycoside phosphotransferase family protein [Nocardia sp. NPDC023852]|uniref:aminoglycoside phosphotransferase family protein n=1 Tax=Nocardia sp. NPDC023852 TaxID=3154697 RepID=UPI0033CC468E
MSKVTKTRVLGIAGRIATHAIRERLLPARPTALTEVPRSPEFLTTEWLTHALCRAVPGAEVSSFTLGSGSDGSTSRRAVTIEYNAAGSAAGLPVDVFTKSTPTFRSRLVTGPTGAAASEALFYNVIRPDLDIEAPTGYFAGVDTRSGRSMFLLEDVSKTRGCTFGDPTTVYIDRAKAEDIVRLLGAVHGTFWESPRFASDLSEIKDAETWQLDVNRLIRFRTRSVVGVDRAADVSPPEFLARRDELWPAFLRSLELHNRGPATLLHSDVHSRNWYINGDGRMGLYDWQCITKGHWGLDVAYALTSALTVEDRRAWEKDLLRIYADQLATSGGPALSLDEVWLGYRQQLFHGLFFWLLTLGVGALEPAMQPEAVSRANLERMTHAVIDLESLDSLS